MKSKLLILLLLIISLFKTEISSAQIITTIAGGGYCGSYNCGNGGQATASDLYWPTYSNYDRQGNLYFCDYNANVVRKVSPAGIISTVAGNATLGFSGDGGQATAAKLYNPTGIAIDTAGNVYIADQWNNRIRKVNTAGIISTFAGTGASGYSGDGGQASAAEIFRVNAMLFDPAGNLLFVDGSNVIRKINTAGIISSITTNQADGYGGDGGPATAAQFYNPNGLALDKTGNIYICDYRNSCIRMINTAGIINTIVGTPTVNGFSGDGGPATAALISYPSGIAVDTAGNIYFTESVNNRVRMVNAAGIISTISGTAGVANFTGDGGPAILAQLNVPWGVSIDPYGSVIIDDRYNGHVRKITVCQTPLSVSISGSASACAGDSIMLTVSGAPHYVWSRNPATDTNAVIKVAATSNTTYTVYGYNSTCVTSATYTVSILPTPQVSFSLQPAGAQIWDAYPVYSGGQSPYSATWNWGDNTSTTGLYPSHPYSTAGKYSICVTLTDANGCISNYCQTDSIYRLASTNNIIQVNVIGNTTGINQLNMNANQLLVYPNPASKTLTIESNFIDGTTEMKINNVIGEEVARLEIKNQKQQVDISQLPNGVYFMTIDNKGTSTTKKIIISR